MKREVDLDILHRTQLDPFRSLFNHKTMEQSMYMLSALSLHWVE